MSHSSAMQYIPIRHRSASHSLSNPEPLVVYKRYTTEDARHIIAAPLVLCVPVIFIVLGRRIAEDALDLGRIESISHAPVIDVTTKTFVASTCIATISKGLSQAFIK